MAEPAYRLDSYQVERVAPLVRNEPTNRTLASEIVISAIAVVIVAISMTYLGQQIAVIRLSQDVNALQQELFHASQRNELLQVELHAQASLSAVETRARSMGMVEPMDSVYIVVAQKPGLPQPNAQAGIAPPSPAQGWVQVVADWMNSWWPSGGVEAGKIGY